GGAKTAPFRRDRFMTTKYKIAQQSWVRSGCLRSVAIRAARALAVLPALMCYTGAYGADASQAVHVDLQLTSSDPAQVSVGGGPTADLTRGGRVVLKPNQYAYFIVDDYDPILYTYNFTVASSPTDSANAIATFANAIKDFGAAAAKG